MPKMIILNSIDVNFNKELLNHNFDFAIVIKEKTVSSLCFVEGAAFSSGFPCLNIAFKHAYVCMYVCM